MIFNVTETCTFQWEVEPQNITQGTFPDSIISQDFSDYLEWESTLSEGGIVAKLKISFPRPSLYAVSYVMGLCKDINENPNGYSIHSVCKKHSYIGECCCIASGARDEESPKQKLPYSFGNIIESSEFVDFTFYQNEEGTSCWRIHNIRVLELVI